MKEKLQVIKSKAAEQEGFPYLIPAVMLDCGAFRLLVELVTGGIVADIDSSKIIKLPGLDEISMNELALLEQAHRLGSFTAGQISLGMNTFRVESIISDLLGKNLLTICDQKYRVTDRYNIMINIEKYATSCKISAEEVEGTKLDAKVPVGKIVERIDSIVKVLNTEQCWILHKKK
jgi:hypothetical protein